MLTEQTHARKGCVTGPDSSNSKHTWRSTHTHTHMNTHTRAKDEFWTQRLAVVSKSPLLCRSESKPQAPLEAQQNTTHLCVCVSTRLY